MLEEVKSVKDRKKMLHIYALQRRGCIARHLSEDNCVLYDTEELEHWKGKPGRPPKQKPIKEERAKEKNEIVTLLTEIKELLKEMKR